MPLTPGKSKATVSKNIEEMIASGHSQQQAVAAALSNADKSGGKSAPFGGKQAPPFGGKKPKGKGKAKRHANVTMPTFLKG